MVIVASQAKDTIPPALIAAMILASVQFVRLALAWIGGWRRKSIASAIRPIPMNRSAGLRPGSNRCVRRAGSETGAPRPVNLCGAMSGLDGVSPHRSGLQGVIENPCALGSRQNTLVSSLDGVLAGVSHGRRRLTWQAGNGLSLHLRRGHGRFRKSRCRGQL
jgi:hypothetical protein